MMAIHCACSTEPRPTSSDLTYVGNLVLVARHTSLRLIQFSLKLYANKGGEEGAQIYPVYLRIVNMFDNTNISHLLKLSAAVDAILKKEQARPDAYSKARSFYPYTWKSVLAGIRKGNWDALEQPIVIDALQKAGFDGATIKEGANHNFMVFKAAQIKSTMNTTWDGKNPNISEGLSG